jgi:hypothetical protein
VCDVLVRNGFTAARLTGGALDGGVDIVAEWPTDHDEPVAAIVQCKSSLSREPLGAQYLRELEGSLSHCDAPSRTVGLLVASSSFTTHAYRHLDASTHALVLAVVDAAAAQPAATTATLRRPELATFRMNAAAARLAPRLLVGRSACGLRCGTEVRVLTTARA